MSDHNTDTNKPCRLCLHEANCDDNWRGCSHYQQFLSECDIQTLDEVLPSFFLNDTATYRGEKLTHRPTGLIAYRFVIHSECITIALSPDKAYENDDLKPCRHFYGITTADALIDRLSKDE